MRFSPRKLGCAFSICIFLSSPVAFAGPALERLISALESGRGSERVEGSVGGQIYRFLGVMGASDAEGAALLAEAVDEEVLGFLETPLGASLCRFTLRADPLLLSRFLGLQGEKAVEAALRCRAVEMVRHPMVGNDAVDLRQGEITSPSRAYALWWTNGDKNELLALSHFGGGGLPIFFSMPTGSSRKLAEKQPSETTFVAPWLYRFLPTFLTSLIRICPAYLRSKEGMYLES
jgi:hypothetical protein